MSLIGIALNLLLVVLLLVAVVVGLRLASRLKALRTGQQDFVKAVAELDQAALRAQDSLAQLRASGEDMTDRLSKQIAQAGALAERLDRGVARAIQSAPTQGERTEVAREALDRAKAQAVLPGRDSISSLSREASSPHQETRRSRARVDDELFDPLAGSSLRSIPGGRRE